MSRLSQTACARCTTLSTTPSFRIRTLSLSVSAMPPQQEIEDLPHPILVEYTPQAYVESDLDMFFRNFSPSQVGQRPVLNSIDGGERLCSHMPPM